MSVAFGRLASIRAGAVVFVRDLRKVTDFYAEVIGLHRAREADDYALLESDSYQLVVHKLPDHIAGPDFTASELVIRQDCALKLVFFVDSISAAPRSIGSPTGFTPSRSVSCRAR